MRGQLATVLWLACKDWRLFLADRRAAVLCFAVPVVLASAFGLVFHKGAGHSGAPRLPLLIVAEGAAHASQITYEIRGRLKREVRMVVLGHIQRGGNPSAFDRILASRLGSAAVHKLLAGEHGIMVGMVADQVQASPLLKEGVKPRVPLEEFLAIQAQLN